MYGVKNETDILHEIERRKDNWIGHILHINCLLKRIIEGKIEHRIEVTGRRGKRRKHLLGNLKEARGYRKLEELNRTLWRTHFERCYGHVVRQTTYWMNVECVVLCSYFTGAHVLWITDDEARLSSEQ
jgi:hypothetical protein